MQHPYETLKLENAALLSGAHILPAIRPTALAVGKRLLTSRTRYEEIQTLTTVLVVPDACIHERECSGDFRCALCNGEKIIGTSHKTTLVPRGYGPWATFEAGAQTAFHIDGLDKVAAQSEGWTQERAVYEWEAFNGFGPRAHGKHTGYNWAGTNIYNGGKYVSDGVWNPNAYDTQLGCVAVMLAIAELAPDLALRRALPTVTAHTVVAAPSPPPVGHGGGTMSTVQIHGALNALGCTPPLPANNNYDRITRLAVMAFQKWKGLEVDGLCGEITIAALRKALDGLPHSAV
jgi:lysozyme family protein